MSDSDEQRVALFGGSFDPPHICHAMAAMWALQTRPIDEVWWVPTYEHAFGKNLLAYDSRIRMVEAIVSVTPNRMRCSRIEEELGGVSRTVDTVQALIEKHPSAKFSLLMGADLVDELPAWKGADELLELVEIHVIGREGYKSPPTHDLRLPNISSTAIREAIESGNRHFYRPRIAARVVRMIEDNAWYCR